jgi:hypothetical protein
VGKGGASVSHPVIGASLPTKRRAMTKKKYTSRDKLLRKLYRKKYGKWVDVYIMGDAVEDAATKK